MTSQKAQEKNKERIKKPNIELYATEGQTVWTLHHEFDIFNAYQN